MKDIEVVDYGRIKIYEQVGNELIPTTVSVVGYKNRNGNFLKAGVYAAYFNERFGTITNESYYKTIAEGIRENPLVREVITDYCRSVGSFDDLIECGELDIDNVYDDSDSVKD